MNDNTRHLANPLLSGTACICPMCWSSADARRYAKRRVRRAVRHSARSEINRSLADDNDHNGDADYMIHIARLNLDNVRALRTVVDTFNYDDLP